MGHSRFDRHRYMTLETRDTLMALNFVPDHNVRNMVSGLFDGYKYNTLYTDFMKMPFTSLYTPSHKEAFEKAWAEIQTYPLCG